jgi:hypothetical protein
VTQPVETQPGDASKQCPMWRPPAGRTSAPCPASGWRRGAAGAAGSMGVAAR